MKGYSNEIKGLTRTDLVSVTRGFVSELQADELFAKYGYAGKYKKRVVYVIPFDALDNVKSDLEADVMKHWDSDRERQILRKKV